MKPILSICIPTYQRKKAIQLTLDCLIQVAKKFPKDVEICVSDNGSGDGTKEMLMEYATKCSSLRIRANTKNIGYDKNFIATLEMAQGKYCWVIGDDDTPIPDAICDMINYLKNSKEYIAGLVATGTPGDIRELGALFKKDEYRNKEFIYNFNNYLKKTGRNAAPGFGFISCYLYRTELAKAAVKKINNGCFGWCHLALFLHIVSSFDGLIFFYRTPTLYVGNAEIEDDKIFLPAEQYEMFVNKRINALSVLPVSDEIKDAAQEHVKRYAKAMYLQTLGKTIIMKQIFNPADYAEIESQMRSLKAKVALPLWLKACATAISIIKDIPIVCSLAASLLRLHPRINRYARTLEKRRAGQVKTNAEREI